LAAAPPQRIHANITDNETFILSGNTRPAVARGLARDEGKVPGSQLLPHMSLHFSMSASQRADLDQLLTEQQNRRSPQYHKFLTPEEFADRFGVNNADIAKITRWLEDSGFSILQVARSRTWISFSGSAAHAESAFHLSMRRYSLAGELHFANAGDPHLPKALEGLVESVGGLHNFAMKPQLHRAHPHFTSQNGTNYVAPYDWQTIYDVMPLYGAGLDGTGVTIAVVGQSDVEMTDIEAFRSAAGLPANNPTVVVPPGDHDPGLQSTSGDEGESDLDLEWAGAIAKNANILFVTASMTEGNGVEDSITYAIDNNVAPIVSISYGGCELDATTAAFNTQNSLFAQATAQGMTMIASSGDAGAAACDAAAGEIVATHGPAVDLPASLQYVTGVGGTEFNESFRTYWSPTNNSSNGSALYYIPEGAWNDGFQAATGGGASVLVAKPSWQTGPGVPGDNARDVPDLAFTASAEHDGLLICSQGSCTNGFLDATGNLDVAGGTSASAPAFAGVLALTLQKGGATSRLGNINPNLYSLAQISSDAFHDITVNSNEVDCRPGTTGCPSYGEFGFVAGPGYDQATGWGSLDAYNFAEQWYGDFAIIANPNTLTLPAGASATATVTITPANGFTGEVSFSCSVANLVAVTCSVPDTTVNTSGTTTVTITATSNANTPSLRRFRTLPPSGRGWLLGAVALGIIIFFIPWPQPKPSPHTRALYAVSSASLLIIAIGAVSCGGSSSTSTSLTSGTTSAPQLVLTCNFSNTPETGYVYTGGSCSASGGTAPYMYSISAGALPAGLRINSSSGAITGTPTASGTSSFTVEVIDSGSPAQTATQAQTGFTVGIGRLELSCVVGDGVVGVPYSAQCKANAGTPPYTFSVGQALPPGLSVNPTTGVITGTPTTVIYSFDSAIMSIDVSDSESPPQTAQTTVGISIDPAGTVGETLGVFCEGAGGYAQLGAYFSGGITCTPVNGQSPYSYSISPALPPGMSLGANGGLVGVPTAVGTFPLTLLIKDASSPPLVATIGPNNFTVTGAGPQNGSVIITAKSGAIVNTTTIAVSVQ
jgi:hypothetical protein